MRKPQSSLSVGIFIEGVFIGLVKFVRKSTKVLRVVNIHLRIVYFGLHFLHYNRCFEVRIVDYVLKSLVC